MNNNITISTKKFMKNDFGDNQWTSELLYDGENDFT